MKLPDYQQNVNMIIKDNYKQSLQDRAWNSSFTIQSITLPEVVQSNTIKKKFKIRIHYTDDKDISRTKTVFFGHGDQYVFSNDNSLRIKRLNSQKMNKNKDDIFSPQYWECILLQTSANFVQNIFNVIKPQLQNVWNLSRQSCLIPRKATSRGKNFKNQEQ